MSSVGQALGYVVGGVIGWFVGYPMLGMAIGGMIGGAIDPPKGPKIEGPRLNDLSVQTSTYGAQIPVIKGSVATFGNIFWVENNALKETKKTEEAGGKGGGGQETTTYSYSATFALGLCLGPVDGIRRIWCSGKLLFDSGDAGLEATLANSIFGGMGDMGAAPEAMGAGAIRFYNGSADQMPDPRMQAALGVANTPAYRGLAYIIFEDFQLEDFGNSLMGAQIKVEVVETMSTSQFSVQTLIPNGLFPSFAAEYGDYGFTTSGPYNPTIAGGVMRFDKERTRYAVSLDGRLIARETAPGIAPGATGDPGERFYVGTTAGGHPVYYNTTGPGACGYLMVGAAQFAGKFTPTWELQGACVGADGNLYLHQYKGGVSVLEKYDGYDLSLLWTHAAPTLPYNTTNIAYPYFPGTSGASAVNEGSLYWFLFVAGQAIDFRVYRIAADGALTLLHTFTDVSVGNWAAHTVCPAAQGALCAITHWAGGFYVLDATPVVVPETAPLSEIVESLCLESGLLEASDIDVTALTQPVRGYRITATAAIRAALEPLQACWPFDAIQHGYQLRFVPRGGSSVATVTADDLGAAAPSDKDVIRLSVSREMDSQLPRRVETTFIDWNREYDTGAGPGAERLNTDAVNIRQIELPVVLTADEAAGIEQTLLYLYWLERSDLSFALPPSFGHLESADIITIDIADAAHVVLLERVEYLPDGRLECSAKYNHSPIYTPAAVGENGAVTGQVLTFRGPTMLALLDVPCLSSTLMDRPGLLTAATGIYDSWPGATLLRSDDSGESYKAVDGFSAPAAVIGYATAAAGAGVTHVVDAATRINVRLLAGSLSTVSLDQMLDGANHFAYGAHGRWEIIAAQTVTTESNGAYTLRDLLRGRFGTERHMTTHGATDQIVRLDPDRLRFVGMDVSSINVSRLWRAVTRGAPLDSASDTALTYSGVNLETLAPCDIVGFFDASNNATVGWTRCSRLAVEPFAGIATPLGETGESYEVEIYDPAFTTLKRTIAGLTTPSAGYTAAQQTTDFGGARSRFGVRVYQLSSVVGRGAPGQASIDRYMQQDPLWSLVTFALRGGVEDGIVDAKGNALTVVTCATSTAVADPWGGSIGSVFSASTWTTAYVQAPQSVIAFGTQDFTIDFFCNVQNSPANLAPYLVSTSSFNSSNPLGIYVTCDGAGTAWGGTGKIYFIPCTGISGGVALASLSNVRGAGWKHVEYSREGTTLRLFIDGALEATAVTAGVWNLQGSNLTLFNAVIPGSGGTERAYLRDFRVTIGAVRHKTTFARPAMPMAIS